MTDCWYSFHIKYFKVTLYSDYPEAETKCVEYIKEAKEKDALNLEVYSTLASIKISQCQPDEARKALVENLALWYKDPSMDNHLYEGGQPVDITKYADSWPCFDSRLAISKLLVEVGLLHRALDIIETLHAENDEFWQVWYLFGVCHLRMAQHGHEMDENGNAISLMVVDESSGGGGGVDAGEQAELVRDAKECFEKIFQV